MVRPAQFQSGRLRDGPGAFQYLVHPWLVPERFHLSRLGRRHLVVSGHPDHLHIPKRAHGRDHSCPPSWHLAQFFRVSRYGKLSRAQALHGGGQQRDGAFEHAADGHCRYQVHRPARCIGQMHRIDSRRHRLDPLGHAHRASRAGPERSRHAMHGLQSRQHAFWPREHPESLARSGSSGGGVQRPGHPVVPQSHQP